MIIRTPDYYPQFKCIAGACTDTCCAGWQVDVDDASFAYYKKVGGEFGDRLRSVMVEPVGKAEGQFRIRPDGRCPFLNDENLCDLYTALGEDALCVTCDQYPRFTTEFGNLRETGIALSCKTAAELILAKKESPCFIEREDPNSFPNLNEIDGERFLGVMKSRDKIYEILADRKRSIWDRMILVLYFATDVQKTIRKPARIDQVINLYTEEYMDGAVSATHAEHLDNNIIRGMYSRYFLHYLSQTIIKREWPTQVAKAYHEIYHFPAPWEAVTEPIPENIPQISDCVGQFLADYDRDYEFENLMTYFIFRYYAKGILDKDVLTKVKMAVVSLLMILQCDTAQYLESGRFSHTDQVEICHLYSREVEHSEENFAALCRLFAKKREFSVKNLALLLGELQDREPATDRP